VVAPATGEHQRQGVRDDHGDEQDSQEEDDADGHGNAGELQHESHTWCSDEKLRNRVVKRRPVLLRVAARGNDIDRLWGGNYMFLNFSFDRIAR
jgi:hypothetical protein